MNDRNYLDQIDQLMERIKKGALLTVKAEGMVNTMTIGWATIGYIWQRPILMVAVRDSRYTFRLMEQAEDFTVTIPADDHYNKAIAFCGTKSGRDFDKFKECNMLAKSAIATKSPIVAIPGTHYECKIVYKSAMDHQFLDTGLENLYPKKDYHTLYFGEILQCYQTE